MTDYNSDQGRELRRARLVRVRPKAAPDMMSKGDFQREYRDFHIVRRELMPDVEEQQNVMFCPACHEQEDDELQRARKLHVSYDEDPLRNYRALVTLACKGCGWNEIVPVEAPPDLTDDEKKCLAEANSYRAKNQMAGMQNAAFGGGLLDPTRYSAEMQRQMMKQAQLAQMYGAGPNVMKSLLTGRMATVSGMSVAQMQSIPRRGQALADHIWNEYEILERRRAEARESAEYVKHEKLRQQIMHEMASQVAKKVDEDVMAELRKQRPGDTIRVGTPRKYAPAPPTAPAPLDKNDKAEMARMMDQAYREAKGDPTKLQRLMAQVKEFFT